MRNVAIRHIEYVHFYVQCCDPSYRIHVFFCVLGDPSYRIHVFSCVLGDPSYRIHVFFCVLGDPSYRIHVFSCVLGVWTPQSISLKKALFGHLVRNGPKTVRMALFWRYFPMFRRTVFFLEICPAGRGPQNSPWMHFSYVPAHPRYRMYAFLWYSCTSAV